MAKRKVPVNPFYAVLVVVGVLFAITACAYCVMAFRAVTPADADRASVSGTRLMNLLDHYGMWLMLGELALLAVATLGAIGTDDYWTRQAALRTTDSTPPTPESRP